MVNLVITKKLVHFRRRKDVVFLWKESDCKRYEEIEVDYLDQNFKPQHGKYSGWTAQIIQHEIDHINGIVI